jgi:hypothetical protein
VDQPPQLPQYSIDYLRLFPRYPTREEYRLKTGTEAPPFDPNRNLKRWFDPNPESLSRTITYPRVLARNEEGFPVEDANGKPMLEPMTIDKSFAATVNIPPDNYTVTVDTGGPLYEYECPLRELLPDETLIFGLMNVVVVRNVKLWQDHIVNESNLFLPSDRALLEAIAKAVGADGSRGQ